MSVFTTNGGVRRASVNPRFESQPYRMTPARREALHGPVQPMASPRRIPAWAALLAVFTIAWFGAHLISGAAQ